MKAFEVKIKKNRTEKECQFEWPSWWGEVYEQVDVVAYEDHPETHGKKTEGAVCVCDDATWLVIKGKKSGLIKQLNETAANEKGRAWRPQKDRPDGSKSKLFNIQSVAQNRHDVLGE